eukprot:Gb_22364 [translate_table: standard]
MKKRMNLMPNYLRANVMMLQMKPLLRETPRHYRMDNRREEYAGNVEPFVNRTSEPITGDKLHADEECHYVAKDRNHGSCMEEMLLLGGDTRELQILMVGKCTCWCRGC